MVILDVLNSLYGPTTVLWIETKLTITSFAESVMKLLCQKKQLLVISFILQIFNVYLYMYM